MSTTIEMLRLFRRSGADPTTYNRRLAALTVEHLGREIDGALVADLACGPGHYTRELRRAGATVVPLDIKVVDVEGGPPPGLVIANATHIPFPNECLDGVFCSNLIEHTRDPMKILTEMERVVRPGGWIWLSWTNWYSPYGGHDMSPWHYLGPRSGLAVYRRVKGHSPVCEPGRNLFPLHIGPTLRLLRARPRLRIVDAAPRYYPSQRWILRVPVLREFATWNCAVVLERSA